MYLYVHKQAKQAPHRTESTSLGKCLPALKTAPHAPRFTIAKKYVLPARKCFKTRHNINEATCAKQNEWL